MARIRTILSLALAIFCVFSAAADSSNAAGDAHANAGLSASISFSANDFDWREMVPYLFEAASLPQEQGIKVVLENSRVLRTYIAKEIRRECASGRKQCTAANGSSGLQENISKRIDEIVQEEMLRRHKVASVDYPLTEPFPFTEVAAFRSEGRRDAYFVLNFAPQSYRCGQLEQKYGAPYDTTVMEWYGVYRYKLQKKDYMARAAFKIDPVTGYVVTVAISLKRHDRRR